MKTMWNQNPGLYAKSCLDQKHWFKSILSEKKKSFLKSKDWDGARIQPSAPIARVLVMRAEIGHHLFCTYVSCRYEIHEGRADVPSVRIRAHIYTPSIRVLNKLTSAVSRDFFFPSFPWLLQYPKQHSCALEKLLYYILLFPSIKHHKAMEDTAVMLKQVPQAEAPVVKKVCLTLFNRTKPYWMTALWRQRIFFSIKRAFIKNILWRQHQRQAPCSWHLQSCHAKPSTPPWSPPRMSHTFLYPAASQASSQQHTFPARQFTTTNLQSQ